MGDPVNISSPLGRRVLKSPAHQSPFLHKKLRKFVDHFKGCNNVLEIGCGWGEFQVMLRTAGIPSEGVETDLRRCDHVRGMGFKVHEGAAFSPLVKRGYFDGLFMSNVIEHMTVYEVQELLLRAYMRLAPGAKVIITTANPRCLGVITDTFWNDKEHTRPYPLPMLVEMLDEAGFEILEARPDEDTRPQSLARSLLRWIRTKIVGPYFEASEIYVVATVPGKTNKGV